MMNVTFKDNGSAFLVLVDGLIIGHFSTLGNAWQHVDWMYAIAQQRFTVGKKQTPAKEWVYQMHKAGYLDGINWAEDVC